MTIINMVRCINKIKQESYALDEPLIKYILQSMQARQGWMPFEKHFANRDLPFNVNFSSIECKQPVMTDLLGQYFKLNY